MSFSLATATPAKNLTRRLTDSDSFWAPVDVDPVSWALRPAAALLSVRLQSCAWWCSKRKACSGAARPNKAGEDQQEAKGNLCEYTCTEPVHSLYHRLDRAVLPCDPSAQIEPLALFATTLHRATMSVPRLISSAIPRPCVARSKCGRSARLNTALHHAMSIHVGLLSISHT